MPSAALRIQGCMRGVLCHFILCVQGVQTDSVFRPARRRFSELKIKALIRKNIVVNEVLNY